MIKTKQDLLVWFNDLANKSFKQSILTSIINGKQSHIEEDKQNALLVMDIIQRYEKEIIEIPSRENLKTFHEIVEQCTSNAFKKSINVGTQKRRQAVVAIWKYLKANF